MIRTQQEHPPNSKIFRCMYRSNKWSVEAIESQGILHKRTRGHDKEFTVVVALKLHQKYVVHESLTSLEHNGAAQLYQVLKGWYYWKGLKKAMQIFVRHCLQC